MFATALTGLVWVFSFLEVTAGGTKFPYGPPNWIRDAVIYQVSPHSFVKNGGFRHIIEKLPELKQLGINTLLLQPIFATKNGHQGYDVIDFFSIRSDFGQPRDLQELVAGCRRHGIRIMLDFIPNHTSISHPYAQDIAAKGEQSPYYHYYQHHNDGVKYSSHYHTDSLGFVYYFWKDLVNLDYNNSAVQEWITKICRYWVEQFDIDGYRFDAVWGPNVRNPQFMKKLCAELKSLKPDIFLLAEDKAADPAVFELGYDAAYDWTADTSWVSQWSWQYHLNPPGKYTAFDHEQTVTGKKILRDALFKEEQPAGFVLRFIENNDMPRFLRWHSLEKTEMAAAFLFSLPGIPLLYNGQETGCLHHPYSGRPVYEAGQPIRSRDSLGLFDYYKRLIALRNDFPVLRSDVITEIEIPDPFVLAYERKDADHTFFMLLNLDSLPVNVTIPFENNTLINEIELEDVLTKEKIVLRKSGNTFSPISLDKSSMRWLLVNPSPKALHRVQLKQHDRSL